MIRRPAQSALHVLHLLCALCVAAAASATALAQELDPDRIALLNAGAIFNFVKFAEWPNDRFENDGSPIVIGFLGDDPRLRGFLEEVVRGQRAHGRSIVVRQFNFPAPPPQQTRVDQQRLEEFFQRLRTSHVLFISARTEQERFRTVVRGLDDADVLTVSDIPWFAERGGMIGLTIRDRRVAFDANTNEIRRTNVVVAARVLHLARIVDAREPLERTADAKADLLLDLIRLTRWPQDVFNDQRSPIVIGFVGRDPTMRILNGRIGPFTAHGRPVQIRTVPAPQREARAVPDVHDDFTARLREMHMLFIAARTEHDRVEHILPLVTDANVLTVSDMANFTEMGGMVGLVIEADQVSVTVNMSAIARTRISISPRLPDLARPIGTGP